MKNIKGKVYIKENELNEIISKKVRKVLSEDYNINIPYFKSYDEFETFFEESDGTMDYNYISKEVSGLNFDIYIDICASYKEWEHPLWMYFCDGYGHNDPLVPISISKTPKIEISNYELELSSIDYNHLIYFIKTNLSLLTQIGNDLIDSVDFCNSVIKPEIALSVKESKDTINEMARIDRDCTNLGFDIFVDAIPRTTGHKEYRLKYPINKDQEQGRNSKNYTPMSICENPEFLPPSNIYLYNSNADIKRKKMVQDFIIENLAELQNLCDGLKNIEEYKLELAYKYGKTNYINKKIKNNFD